MVWSELETCHHEWNLYIENCFSRYFLVQINLIQYSKYRVNSETPNPIGSKRVSEAFKRVQGGSTARESSRERASKQAGRHASKQANRQAGRQASSHACFDIDLFQSEFLIVFGVSKIWCKIVTQKRKLVLLRMLAVAILTRKQGCHWPALLSKWPRYWSRTCPADTQSILCLVQI